VPGSDEKNLFSQRFTIDKTFVFCNNTIEKSSESAVKDH
jgi:hypothetical protein